MVRSYLNKSFSNHHTSKFRPSHNKPTTPTTTPDPTRTTLTQLSHVMRHLPTYKKPRAGVGTARGKRGGLPRVWGFLVVSVSDRSRRVRSRIRTDRPGCDVAPPHAAGTIFRVTEPDKLVRREHVRSMVR